MITTLPNLVKAIFPDNILSFERERKFCYNALTRTARFVPVNEWLFETIQFLSFSLRWLPSARLLRIARFLCPETILPDESASLKKCSTSVAKCCNRCTQNSCLPKTRTREFSWLYHTRTSTSNLVQLHVYRRHFCFDSQATVSVRLIWCTFRPESLRRLDFYLPTVHRPPVKSLRRPACFIFLLETHKAGKQHAMNIVFVVSITESFCAAGPKQEKENWQPVCCFPAQVYMYSRVGELEMRRVGLNEALLDALVTLEQIQQLSLKKQVWMVTHELVKIWVVTIASFRKTIQRVKRPVRRTVVTSQTISLVSQKRLASEVGISLFIGSGHTIWWVVLTISQVCHTTFLPHQGVLAFAAIFNICIFTIIIHKYENSWI